MEHLLQIKLIDKVRQALKYREDPPVICSQSRKTCETILSLIWQKEFGEYPTGLMFQALADGLKKNKPNLIPDGIQKLFGTIQHFGNFSSHPQANLEELEDSHASMVEAAMTRIANWYFIDYLKYEPPPDFGQSNQSEDAQTTSYRQLFTSMLEDGVFELDEYENLVDIRKSLQLPRELYKSIEQQVILHKLGRSVESVREILKPSDLYTFKRKFEGRDYDLPEWLTRTLIQIKNDAELSEEYRNILVYHLQPDQTLTTPTQAGPISFLGCWQGWYAQNSMKTFFDLFFIARSDSSFIGITYEPINPIWQHKVQEEDGLVVASITGENSEEGIFSFNKRYLFEKPWEIQYTGVVLDDGQYFEGEWEVKRQSGSFNAIKTKYFLPIHIFNTDSNRPITRFQHLGKRKNITGTWFIRLAGRETSYVLLHLMCYKKDVKANVVYLEEGMIKYQFISGSYDGVDRVILERSADSDEAPSFINLRFSVDWMSREINGTVKERKYALRSLKGYRI